MKSPIAPVVALAATFMAALPAAPALAQMGPMPVTVALPVPRKVTETSDFTGRFQAWPTVSVTSRVTGYLDTATFTEGGLVKEGDTLFTIDPRPLQSAVDQAEAQVKIAQTRVDLARTNLRRSEELRRSGNVTDALYQSNQQAFLEARAAIDSSKAALANARLDLEFSTIKAPVSGRIGRKLVSPGNLVVANGPTPLTTIVAVNPIYFYFDFDEASYLKFRRAAAADIEKGKPPAHDVRIALSDEKTYSRKGTLDYLDPQVDMSTGTVTVRAKVDNPDGFLTPGLFGRVEVPLGDAFDALILPDSAVGRSAEGPYVMVIGDDDAAAPRPVVLGPKFGALRALRSGVGPKDRVLINGQMRAPPGGKVKPELKTFDVPAELTQAEPQ